MYAKFTASTLLFASILTTPALAEEPVRDAGGRPDLVTVEARIEIGDVDLRTSAGMEEVLRRVSRAASEMCRPEAVPDGLGRGRLDGHCYRRALADGRAQIERATALRQVGAQASLSHAARVTANE
jgi:UrcA family protein